MKHRTAGKILTMIGIFLILGSGLLFGFNLWNTRRAAESVENTMTELEKVLADDIVPADQYDPEQNDDTDADSEILCGAVDPEKEMPVYEVNGVSYVGVLEIPSLGLELPIISQWSNDNARIAPCRYQGSAYLDNLIICAHNYKSHFGKLSVLSLEDTVLFEDMEGNQFRYQVVEFEVMDGTAIEQMESGDWDLTLFTCTVGGNTRLTVRCQRIDD